MSLAQRQQQRRLAGVRFDHAAAAAAALAAAAERPVGPDAAPRPTGESPGGPGGAPAPADRPRGSLAERRRNRRLAGQAGERRGPLPASPADGPRASAYAHQLIQLGADRRRLKEIQSVERKILLKRELLPAYRPWIDGVLESGAAVQDEIVTTMMIWSIDVGDFAQALRLATYVVGNDLALPERFDRNAATLVTEEIAEGALAVLGRGEPFDVAVLVDVEQLTGDCDMPDEVRAKLFKATGQALQRAGDDTSDAAAAGAQRAYREAALNAYRRALELNPRAGVKKELERLERELKKDVPA